MEIDKLKGIFTSKLDWILAINQYEGILRKSVNMLGLDFINLSLVVVQNYIATNIKSELDWSTCGRILNTNFDKKITPIYLIVPEYRVNYQYKSGECITDKSEFTSEDLGVALKSGIVKKIKEVEKFYSSAVYDISDTSIVDMEMWESYEKKTRQQNTLKASSIAASILNNFDVEVIRRRGETSSFSVEGKQVIIGDSTSSVETLVEALIMFVLNENGIGSKFIESSVKYAIYSKVGLEDKVEKELINIKTKINELQICDIASKIETCDTALGLIAVIINILYTVDMVDILDSLQNMKRADILLDIMEANNMRNKIRRML